MSTGKKYTYDELIDMVKESSYTAPDVWSEIAGELDLSQKVTQLPQYKAPDHIWDNIAAEIEVAPQKISNDSSNKTNWVMLVVGIVIGVLALALIQYFFTTDHKDKFEYKSEIEMASLYDNKVEVEENISDVLEYIEQNSFLFDEEQLQEFNTQLEEINEALKQLMELQEKYGLDESSHKLMARMERDRATLLKSMISDT
jgi:flagellar basal body-associated protein FliL